MTNFRTTAKKYTEDLETLAWSDTFYKNVYPYNTVYCYGGGRFSADCNNLIKALVNGREIKNAGAGTYQPVSDMPLTGDCTELGLLNKCKNVTTDFSNMGHNPHVLYMDGHVGTYLGYEVEVYGQIYNTVECTAWTGDVGHNGVIYSYTDTQGNRRYHKDGSIKSKWEKNGDMSTLVDCSVLSDKVRNTATSGTTKLTLELPILKYGSQGNAVKNLQGLLNIWMPSYTPLTVDGSFGTKTEERLIAYQKAQGLYADGVCGSITWTDLLIG